MSANTAHGFPYPLGTDRVMDGDDAIKALAQTIDTQIQRGTYSARVVFAAGIAANAVASVAVTFPAGMFTQIPFCVSGPVTSFPQNSRTTVSSITATGATVFLQNISGVATTTAISADLIAHQST